jgi:hypothetical protein
MITSPLIQAVLDGEIDKVRSLIKNHPEMLGVRSENGSFPYQIAVKKGLASQQTALLRVEAPGGEYFTEYSDLLIHYLGDISNAACASWLRGIEFIVWKSVFADGSLASDIEGFHDLDEEAKKDLRFLSRKAQGWVGWTDKDEEPVFVPIEQWNEMWQECQNKIEASRQKSNEL